MCIFAPKDVYTLSFKHLILTGKMPGGLFQNCQGQSPPTTGACVVTVKSGEEKCSLVPPKRAHTGQLLPGAGQRHQMHVSCALLSVCLLKAVIVLWDPFLATFFFPIGITESEIKFI